MIRVTFLSEGWHRQERHEIKSCHGIEANLVKSYDKISAT